MLAVLDIQVCLIPHQTSDTLVVSCGEGERMRRREVKRGKIEEGRRGVSGVRKEGGERGMRKKEERGVRKEGGERGEERGRREG